MLAICTFNPRVLEVSSKWQHKKYDTNSSNGRRCKQAKQQRKHRKRILARPKLPNHTEATASARHGKGLHRRHNERVKIRRCTYRYALIISVPSIASKYKKAVSKLNLLISEELQISLEVTEKAQVCCHTPTHSDRGKAAHELSLFLYQNVLEYDNQCLEYTIEDHDITLRIPEKSIPDGEKVHIQIGVAAYGPFIFPKNTQPISPIVWLCILEKGIELQKPFQLVLPHYLTGLTIERISYHQVKFVKAIRNDFTSDEQRGLYKFDFCDPDPLFASTGDKSYGVLESTHCCFYCLEAEETPELANDASYCLTRIERPLSVQPQKTEVYFIATYFLKTHCIQV